jgi:dimeric dUTPase (all-alpha-NTP-PPase superfamily)
MNLGKLFQLQLVLDEHIMNEHPELKGQNNLDWKVLALLVELGECTNEWRGFKKWSKNQEPRLEVECHACKGLGEFHHQIFQGHEHIDDTTEICTYCSGTGIQERPLLEEYVDCLHFILSIGLEMSVEKFELGVIKKDSLIEQFLGLANAVSVLAITPSAATYGQVFSAFVGLGEMLGFSWEEVEKAYFDKNVVNHQRQESGY